ncbi:Glycosyl transferase ALG6/ALG8 [Trinorchestia longiramus]|nr:Glycosyl transferase ALG6/ALG8 [Trinorchestia longiramus]
MFTNYQFLRIVAGISCVKLLFLPCYYSTDFEVHRNWLAITHSLPINQWYVDTTSEWTLDYPPLFAWFEWLLAKVAVFFDPAMLHVESLNYSSSMTVLFQRLSVIVTDLLFAWSARLCCLEVGRRYGVGLVEPVFVLLVCNCGLLLVDHIHFQYNGFLMGFLFLTYARMLQGRNVEATLWFSVLLCLKHIYLYMAPALLVYMLRSHCLHRLPGAGKVLWKVSIKAMVQLAVPAVAVAAAAFGPFVMLGQTGQVLSRLFPFKRGLSHAYWAPNFWALYNAADKFLAVAGRRSGWYTPRNVTTSSTAGLVQELEHEVLPPVLPAATFIITALSMMPVLVWLWRNPYKPWCAVRASVVCTFCSYMFAWHVHEKAILLVILPLSLLCVQEQFEARTFLLTSIVGHFSLFPLLFTAHETPLKISLWLLYTLLCWRMLSLHWYPMDHHRLFHHGLPNIPLTSLPQTLYLLGLLPLLLLQVLSLPSLPFLPLLLTSLYCGLGLSWAFISYYWQLLHLDSDRSKTA